MEIEQTKSTQVADTTQVSTTDTEKTTASTTEVPEEFSAFFTKASAKSAGQEINEEELFATLVEKKLEDESAEAAEFFRGEKATLMTSMARADGVVSMEDVTNAALLSTVSAGHIDDATSKKIYGESFKAAQLDANLTALFDGRGSAEDPTIAVATVEEAMAKSYFTLQQIENGEITTDETVIPTDSANPGTGGNTSSQASDGAEGFLWKPESESDGNLVVLLPTALRGLVEGLAIYSSPDMSPQTLLGEGRFAGDSENGERPHYRFSKPGSDYGDNLYVTATLENGDTQTWQIDDGGKRVD